MGTEETQPVVKGRGCICIDVWFWEDIGRPETIEAFRKALLLPDTYEIERMESTAPEDLGKYVCKIFVRHPAIPVVAESEPLPVVQCIYLREGEEVKLDHININQRVDDQWKTVYTDVPSAEEPPNKQEPSEILLHVTKEPRSNQQHKDVAIQCLEVTVSSLRLAYVNSDLGKDEELPLMMDVLQGFVNRLQSGKLNK